MFSRALASRPGATHGGDVGSLCAGIVANRWLFRDVVLRQYAQVHHQRMCFFVESELGIRHDLIFFSDGFPLTMIELTNSFV